MVEELLVLREYFAELPKDRRTLTKRTAKAECRSMALTRGARLFADISAVGG